MTYTLMVLISDVWVDVLPKSNNVSWTSSADTLSVELTFDSLSDIVEGTHIMLKIDDKMTFTGIVVRKVKKKLSYSYACYDWAFYLNKNETIIQFNKVTADVAIKQLCTQFGIKCNCVKISYIVQDTAETTVLSTSSSTSNTTSSSSLVAVAKKYLGVKYLWGGTTPSGFDCSGFTQYVFKQLKINISRTTYTQVKEGTYVAKANLQAGDLVFFGSVSLPHHVAMYIGGGNVIQAPHTGDVVKITPLKYFSDYATARRINVATTTAKAATKTVAVATTGAYAGGYANGLYKDWINAYARQNGYNPNLIAGIIEVESSFDCNSKNASGHVGLGQFDYTSAKEVGLINSSGDHRTDPRLSIQAICQLLTVKYKATGTLKKAIMTYGENTNSYYNKVVAATPGHDVGAVTSGKTGTVTATKSTTETTITTNISKIYKDMTLSAIIDDILNNATLEKGTKYIKEMISDILYIRVQAEYKIFPKFMLNEDLIVNSSIENMKNTVIATGSDDKSTKILATVSDPINIKIYGGLQEVLTLDLAYDIAHANNVATNFLKLNNKIFHDAPLSITVIEGAEEIRANRFIGLIIESMGLNGWYNIKSCANVLVNGQCKSSITLEW
ncbi:NlpC/P60 family protein [Clostridium estertheticum]|uniref:XkdQ/YqbQ family protein n=1 Tax=Clostridium estertheticum TaxID=238834 RepID=UPI001CF2AC4C|nr:NlpC/P60 family protein [Clostridium estertheticum]MCB2309054.1 NlpC/P60 family protein [Clostridium estertheticum]MCB2346812.1 NlpC/P60 family protein [Clostridium estertheticum]MCB2351876.1 NlpC/P60 family protein [Clostridium estertheticum]WAG48404.1 NlpC/P60 family protein [Clostridium estertheticum]